PLVHDVQTLGTINRVLQGRTPNERQRTSGHRQIPYILIAPERPDEIGHAAAAVYRDSYAGVIDAARSPSLALLGRALDAGASAARGELFSYLFFAPEFAEALIE